MPNKERLEAIKQIANANTGLTLLDETADALAAEAKEFTQAQVALKYFLDKSDEDWFASVRSALQKAEKQIRDYAEELRQQFP